MSNKLDAKTVKAIPAKEMKSAIKSLNEYLDEKDEDKVIYVGVSKEQALENFLFAILEVIEKDEADLLPENVVTFYNEHLVNDDDEEKEKKTDKPKDKKKSAPKKSAPKKSKKAKEPKKPGVVQHIIEAFIDDDLTTAKDIIASVEKKHGVVCSKSTISNVLCVLKPIRNRITPKK